MRYLLILLLSALSLSAYAEGYENIKVNGTNRRMWVHVPEGLPSKAPLVISFHGVNGTGQGQCEGTRWDAVADTAKFVVVYPDGEGTWWDVYGDKDLKFVETIIDNMHKHYDIDLDRVYATGFSLGSMFTYHCAEHLADKIAAFGPVGGVRFDAKAPKSTRRVPIIHTHGTNDDVFKWGGDPQHQAGGYPAIADYVKSWAMYFGLNPKAEVIDPYRNCSLTIWSEDDSSLEVRLLAVKGVGHWHSEGSDWGDISTSREIWNFVKNYTLQPEPECPKVVDIVPENDSFDLSDADRSFTLTLDREINPTKATAQLVGLAGSYNLVTVCDANTLTVSLPDGVKVADGFYTLKIDGVQNIEGGKAKKFEYNYTYGTYAPTKELQVEDVFANDWSALYDQIGEGIPAGWRRVMSRNDGTREVLNGVQKDIQGARMKYFAEGGAFSAGFYFSARDYDMCEFNYGNVKSLTLEPGVYDVRFCSTYWNQSAASAATKYNMYVCPRGADDVRLVNVTDILSEGCLNENSAQTVTLAMDHVYPFTVETKGKYILNFNISEGWNAVVLGAVSITTHQSSADKYKGGLYRLILDAKDLYGLNAETLAGTDELQYLAEAIDAYSGLQSTSPSDYAAAMDVVRAAMEAVAKIAESGISDSMIDRTVVNVEHYTLDGRLTCNDYQGLAIKRTVYSDGTVSTVKLSR